MTRTRLNNSEDWEQEVELTQESEDGDIRFIHYSEDYVIGGFTLDYDDLVAFMNRCHLQKNKQKETHTSAEREWFDEHELDVETQLNG